jgi:pimeloyl-ACP methyl ester carboxylesterase
MLHYRTAGDGKPLVIVHGLFGAGDNWWTLAGKFPGYKTYLPDLRNHGNSPWYDSFKITDLAGDLAEFAGQLGLGPCPWIGHSLGGKAVLELALTHPQAVTGVAALDMAPRGSEPRYPGFVTAMKALDLNNLPSRGEAVLQLERALDTDRGTIQFLAKSLASTEEAPGWKWKLNLDALENEYDEIWKPLAPGRSWNGSALFLYGAASDYFKPGDEALAKAFFPNAEFEAVEGAGHWLHAEKPAEVLAALNAWLSRVARA